MLNMRIPGIFTDSAIDIYFTFCHERMLQNLQISYW